ncbi:alpha-D-ribose 1-methylphosphonate 5-triphosphate diphosphatase [Roseibium sp. CAU 1637]|uniref:Alpha-D-ribose 1-methylphosphonate 5-triphosphate diphosphatase n=1 Tax=Roseibium limicola TaxID=2816037 RepID=A0A939EQ20_9HYPH|nr:alpha-D-ribose 1-methylphosphonate 5-triphosphate diphosphatase [Roseibium limicola]MBO0346840.1 alpha-D-ribose 1-methylphosphonate 5-triphosphate diphosphatase [Roseibium limicola]
MNDMSNTATISSAELVLANATLVLADECLQGHLTVSNGIITDISTGSAPRSAMNLAGAYVLPGLVDIHTDHFEKHILPRAHVRWDAMRAALAHDAQIIGSGTTTVFDSLAVGSVHKDVQRREILGPMIEALTTAQENGMLKAEHFIHLRCELTGQDTPELITPYLDRDIVRILSVMEHLPGRRQSRDVEHWLHRHMKEFQVSRAESESELAKLSSGFDEIIANVRPQVIALAKQHGLPVLSHDDTEPEHIPEALADGIKISEFPCTLEAARLAREHGMLSVGGAPNVLRGGSQSGNVAVADLMAEGLIDILASDYVPRSLLDAAFLIARDDSFAQDLPAAVRMVTKAPTEAAGLNDRGELAIGRRADLLVVETIRDQPVLRAVWRAGARVS